MTTPAADVGRASKRPLILSIVSAAGIVAAFVAALALTVVSGTDLLKDFEHANVARAHAVQAGLIGQAEALQRAYLAEYLVDHDPRDIRLFEQAERRSQAARAAIAKSFPANKTIQRRIAINAALDVRQGLTLDRIVRALRAGRSNQAYGQALAAELLVERQVAHTADITREVERQADLWHANARRDVAHTARLLVPLCALALVLAVMLAWLLARNAARAIDRLSDSEERFRTLVSNVPGVVYRRQHDAEWTIEFVSSRIEEITGYPVSDLVDNRVRSYGSIVHPDDRDLVAHEVEDAVTERRPYHVVYRVLDASGNVQWIDDKGEPVRGGDGTVLSLDGTLSDVTDRKLLEEERDQMELDLRVAQKLEAVGQLAAGIAHEINTPIQFVGDSVRFLNDSFDDMKGLLQAYRDAFEDVGRGQDMAALRPRIEEAEYDADIEYLEERVPAAFERTLDGIERVTTTVRAMKEFAHPAQADLAPADLNAALRSTLIVARNEYKYVANLEEDLDPALPPVVCKLSDLNQVFLNLIVNAAHAIEDVVGETGEQGLIRVTTQATPDHVTITIGDSGKGIPAEIRTRIFDPFFTTKEVGRGTGQGLAIARTMIEKHGGSIGFETETGRGTTFNIRLPIGGAEPGDAPDGDAMVGEATR